MVMWSIWTKKSLASHWSCLCPNEFSIHIFLMSCLWWKYPSICKIGLFFIFYAYFSIRLGLQSNITLISHPCFGSEPKWKNLIDCHQILGDYHVTGYGLPNRYDFIFYDNWFRKFPRLYVLSKSHCIRA